MHSLQSYTAGTKTKMTSVAAERCTTAASRQQPYHVDSPLPSVTECPDCSNHTQRLCAMYMHRLGSTVYSASRTCHICPVATCSATSHVSRELHQSSMNFHCVPVALSGLMNAAPPRVDPLATLLPSSTRSSSSRNLVVRK